MHSLILVSIFSCILLAFILPQNIMGYIGMFSCFILSAMGTGLGINYISKYVSGASINEPRVATKSILGTVVCEANFLTGIITCIMINNNLNSKTPENEHYVYFASGLFVGLCNYYSSVATGMICGIITMMDAKNPNIFFKVAALEIIPASVGLMGFIIGIVLNNKVN